MSDLPFCHHRSAIPLILCDKAGLEAWLATQTEALSAWVKSCDFTAAAGSFLLLPAVLSGGASEQQGALGAVLVGWGDDFWACADLAIRLPAGNYRLDDKLDRPLSRQETEDFTLAWALGSYRFRAYQSQAKPEQQARLVWPDHVCASRVEALARGIFLTRDLINTPANDMGPADLAAATGELAARFGAQWTEIVGDDLLTHNFPALHAVGRASASAPRLIELRWNGPEGDTADRLAVTLVGKGICFDSGGLDLKPPSNMRLMKKDMGGAAHVLGVASAIMACGLPCRLRVLIPAAENAVAGNAFRPGDVIDTRKGLRVEIGNTDAEGRLVLCDALDLAAEDKPDLIVDFATLTGAARVALGADLPALFSNSDDLAQRLRAHSVATQDEVWHLPLHRPYRKLLDSAVADLNNVSSGGFAGAITAALYLDEFVPDDVPWAHLDVMAWNGSARSGRPEGGEALGLRAVFALIADMVRR